jgi:hypothetical protein
MVHESRGVAGGLSNARAKNRFRGGGSESRGEQRHPWVGLFGCPDVVVLRDTERRGDLIGEKRPERLAGDTAHDLPDQVALGETVVAGGGAGLPPGFLLREQLSGPFLVVDVVEGHVLSPAGQTGGVTQQLPHPDPGLAGCAELGPVIGHRRIQVQLTAISKEERAQRGHRLGRGEAIRDRVA